ncbi:MAG: hypothetical protein IH596_10575 [Bacteroidales bacterium]|nr:hypothetical protein [Bacteroidales bacterium]
MNRVQVYLIVMVILLGCLPTITARAQYQPEPDTLPDNVLTEKQWALGLLIHTNGWGLKFRYGTSRTALRVWLWEAEYSTYKSAKEIRVLNPYYPNSKSYIYGKVNSVSFLRIGTGQQYILNRKPYWGGVQLSILWMGGVTVGFAKPMYLYIIYPISQNEYEIKEERYDPANHFADDIYGRASLLAGILELSFHPGIYARSGLEFEFGNKNKRPKALEVGACLDVSPIGIPIMAYNPKQNLFLTLYLSFTFGKRYN